MGRDNRQRAKFSFHKREIEFYRPTDGQGAAFAMIAAAKTDREHFKGAVRFFTIIEKLTVSADDWDWLDGLMVDGTADVPEYATLMQQVFQYEWDEESDE
jgi:hypothetical protein